ncbi:MULTISPECIES: efflux RND transporter periplasmic adaptor subunit [unclassified Shewanella]|uniref:efflux RND transporter periplasmic adaptor subunit n=1 Tax=unclassified Shewanella TaxID=196818 RepID=UPI000C857FE3|nr:efflux RND transporter periplasmic adaptor subunit [Shewanella sp. 10N.286.51.B7]PMG78809.1 efflux transporter periplasmic adaptor subunit [Shewanella sp. 10N.286.51.B7]
MKKLAFLIIVSSLIAAVVSFSGLSQADKAKPHAKGKAQKTIPVVTGIVDQHELSQSLSLIGKLDAEQSVFISSQVAGKISDILIKPDQDIQAGQVMVQLDDSKAKAATAEAAAYLADEKRKLKEFLKLISSNAITQTEIDAQRASVDIAAARLAAAQADLDYHSLNAPFSGSAGLIDFSVGKMISVGTELLSFDNLSTMRLDLQVPEHYLSLLSNGMKVSAQSRAWPSHEFNGEIVAIDSRINQDTLNLRVRVEFANPDNKLKPGMMMAATLSFPAVSEPVIPVQAIEYSGTKRFVYLVDSQNIAKRTEVNLGARIDNEVLISEGLSVGDIVVVQGLVNMRDGVSVDVLEQQGTAEKLAHEEDDSIVDSDMHSENGSILGSLSNPTAEVQQEKS